MNVIARGTLITFAEKHPGARIALQHWYSVARKARWATMADVQATFSKAKVLNGERVRFEIAGGDFRMIASFNFERATCFIKFVGSHAEYDKIDALTVSLYWGLKD
jgi:mRNA interferase HigB